MTTRAERAAQDAKYIVNADEFRQILKEFKKNLKNLLVIHGIVSKLSRNQYAVTQEGKEITLPDGQVTNEIDRNVYNLWEKKLFSDISQLGKYFTKSYHRKRKGPRPTLDADGNPILTGFERPAIMSENLRKFFDEADLGLVDDSLPHDPDTNPYIRDQISLLLQNRMSSPAVLTPLFTIYARKKKLTNNATSNRGKDENLQDGGRLGADDAMKEAFRETFTALTLSDKELDQKAGVRFDKRTKRVITPFDPNDFQFASFQSIIAMNSANPTGSIVRKRTVVNPDGTKSVYHSDPIAVPRLTPELQEMLLDQQNRRRLMEEQKFVSSVNKHQNDLLSPDKKKRNAEKRRAKAQEKPKKAASPKKAAARPVISVVPKSKKSAK